MSRFDCAATVPGFEIDAVERVLSEADGHMPDGYWRALARDSLEAARDARLAELSAVIDRELASSAMARVGTLDSALGEGRN